MATVTLNAAEEFQEALHFESIGKLDRAIDIFVKCLATAPTNLEFWQGLLRVASRKSETAPTTAAPAAHDLAPEIKRAWSNKNWSELLSAATKHLAKNPFHAPTLLAAADASEAEELFEHEVLFLGQSRRAEPNNLEVLRRLGRAYIEFEDYGEALGCWQRIEELLPDDEESTRMVTELTIANCRQRSGVGYLFNDAASNPVPKNRTRRPHRHASQATLTDNVLGEIQGVHSKLRHVPMQQLEAAVRDAPGVPDNYLRLASLYLEKGREYDAERLLAKGQSETNQDSRVRHLFEDVRLTRLENKIALARKHAELQDTPEIRAELEELTRTREQVETEIFASRSERDPENAGLHFQLGMRLVRGGNLRTACHHFKAAMLDHRFAGAAAFEMGECLRQARESKEALRAYRIAADSPTDAAHLDRKTEALFRAAELAAQIKLFRLAQRYLTALLQIQPTHQDANTLVQQIQRRSQEEA